MPASELNRTKVFQHCLVGSDIAIAYWLSAQFGLWTASVAGHITMIWPPIGITTALLFRYGNHFWPWVWAASLIVNRNLDNPIAGIWIATTTTIAIRGMAMHLRRQRFQLQFETLSDYQRYVLTSVVGCILTSSGGTLGLIVTGIQPWQDGLSCLLTWWLGDVAGMVVFGPVAYLATHQRLCELVRYPLRRLRGEALVCVAVLGLVLVCGLLSNGVWTFPLVFLPIVCAVRAAIKLHVWAVSLVILTIAIFAVLGLHQGAGPLTYLQPTVQLYAVWGYIVTTALLAIGVSAIIAERNSVERQLRSKEQNYHAVVNDNPALICRFSSDGILRFVNETFREAFSISVRSSALHRLSDQLIQNFFTLATARQAQQIRDQIAQQTNPLEPFTFETSSGTGNGVRWFRWTARGVGLTSSAVPEYHAIGLDVTEQKRAETERQSLEAKALLTQRYEAIGVLAGGVAHEFNNIFCGILGNTEYVLSTMNPNDPHYALLKEVYLGATRAAELTRQLNLFAGRCEYQTGPVDLSSIVRDTRQLVDVVVPKNCPLQLELKENLPPTVGDTLKIRHLLMSLITNAAEACLVEGPGRQARPNTSITVRTGLVPVADAKPYSDWLNGEHLGPGLHIELAVLDTGVGMSEETLRRAYDPFFTTKFPGRGLGLSAVLGIVQDHLGAISITSQPGRGTEVRVLFPAVENVADFLAKTPLPKRHTERIRLAARH